nr:unnamed protein product [Digitaria exilis]
MAARSAASCCVAIRFELMLLELDSNADEKRRKLAGDAAATGRGGPRSNGNEPRFVSNGARFEEEGRFGVDSASTTWNRRRSSVHGGGAGSWWPSSFGGATSLVSSVRQEATGAPPCRRRRYLSLSVCLSCWDGAQAYGPYARWCVAPLRYRR